MALIKCYECGQEISDKAPSCPHCGAPKLVAANKGSGSKKAHNFAKYLKPIGIGLGVIVIPLAAVASVPLIQANGNLDAVVWRFKNKKFIKHMCTFRHLEKTSLPKNCRSLIYKLGEKATKVSYRSHKACMSEKKFDNLKVYDSCISKWDSEYKRRARIKRFNHRDTITFKGKTYKASRSCPDGKSMYWQTISGFMRKTKISELGCMTSSENEAYWRNYKLRQAGAPRGGGGGSGYNYQSEANRMRIQTNEYKRYLDNYSKDMGW